MSEPDFFERLEAAGPEAWNEQCMLLAREAFAHPLARRHMQRVDATGDNTIHTPADVLGERWVRVGALLAMAVAMPDDLFINWGVEQKPLALLALGASALQGKPYLWTHDVRDALVSSLELDEKGRVTKGLPRHVLSRSLLPETPMWWTFESGLTVSGTAAMDAIVVTDLGGSFSAHFLGEGQFEGEEHDGPFVVAYKWDYGTVYPDDYTGDNAHASALEQMLSHLAFLNSPYIPKERKRLTRPERRDVLRAKAATDDDVTFIILRRPEPRDSHDEGDESSVDWKHRWVVSGHYRAQWYPSEQAHHVIWIAPYMKGPDDAPLLEHAYKVAR